MKRRKRTEQLSLENRLRLLRNGMLSDSETARFAGDVGNQNFIEARADIEGLLDHPASEVRYEALGTLAYEWGLVSDTGRVIEIALSDPEAECRRQAAGALGSLFRRSRNQKVLAVLVSIARNTLEEDGVRAFAYSGALDVIGMPRSKQPNPVSLTVRPDELAALNGYLQADWPASEN